MDKIETAYKKGIAYSFTASDIQNAIIEAKEYNNGKTFKEAAARGNSPTFTVRFQSEDEYTGIIFKNNQFKEIKTKDKTVIFNRLSKIPVKACPNLYGKTAVPTNRDLRGDIRSSDIYKNADTVKKLYFELAADNKPYNMAYGLNKNKVPTLRITLKSASMDRLDLLVFPDKEILAYYDKRKSYTVYPDGKEVIAREIIRIDKDALSRFKKQQGEIKKIINLSNRIVKHAQEETKIHIYERKGLK